MKERESMSNHQKQVSQAKEFKRELVAEVGGGFDVYNVETALPKIEWDTVEANLRAASEEEKRDMLPALFIDCAPMNFGETRSVPILHVIKRLFTFNLNTPPQ
ncbi:hypothetical protein DAPPUDRAFT_108299 [Daphnia pulex]|uniref:Uncharacterized protein n=1 Tax=Daphnia pulex TaxID=6669 RepID=E9GZR1_DAPPU|nr:hypothetical protein DAPPUDRAFT_108299 [Daphnia pulex]|eukprot:EFX75061.1 hypothetical protein DAPPUDRAFT_108299 [Daphnia pulex]